MRKGSAIINALMSTVLIILAIGIDGQEAVPQTSSGPVLVVAEMPRTPVITAGSPGTEGNQHGFEGGNVVKVDGVYHMATTEMSGKIPARDTKLAHWISSDRYHWKRVGTLYTSSGEFAGKDPRASLWAPMFVYDHALGSWSLFYVAYRSAPNTKTEWRLNFEGRIWRAVSTVKGPKGIDGPYVDAGVILQPDANSQPWEGLQGTDSFFPYRVGKRWLGFYGSANTERTPVERWRVGLAEAPQLSGPWQRLTSGNPVYLDPRFVENPIVTKLDDGSYIAVYDNEHQRAVGYAWSADGVNWKQGRDLEVLPEGVSWANHVRTPLGLVPEGNNSFTLFFTACRGDDPSQYCSVGLVMVKLVAAQ